MRNHLKTIKEEKLLKYVRIVEQTTEIKEALLKNMRIVEKTTESREAFVHPHEF